MRIPASWSLLRVVALSFALFCHLTIAELEITRILDGNHTSEDDGRLMSLGLSPSHAAYSLYGDAWDKDVQSITGILVPLDIDDRCSVALHPISILSASDLPSDVSSVILYVFWGETNQRACFDYSTLLQGVAAKLDNINRHLPYPARAMLMSSTKERCRTFGGLFCEVYGDYRTPKPPSLQLSLISHELGEQLNQYMQSQDYSPLVVKLKQDLGPWNQLIQSTGFQAQKWIFVSLLGINFIWAFVRAGKILCSRSIFHRIFLLYVSSMFYLAVNIFIPPERIQNTTEHTVMYCAWIVGFLIYCSLQIGWGFVCSRIDNAKWVRYVSYINYVAIVNFLVVALLCVGAYIGNSARIYRVSLTLMHYEVPGLFVIQLITLAYFGYVLLKHSRHFLPTSHAGDKIRTTVLTLMTALVGYLIMSVCALLVITNQVQTVRGFTALIILYKTASWLLFGSELWVLILLRKPISIGKSKPAQEGEKNSAEELGPRLEYTKRGREQGSHGQFSQENDFTTTTSLEIETMGLDGYYDVQFGHASHKFTANNDKIEATQGTFVPRTK